MPRLAENIRTDWSDLYLWKVILNTAQLSEVQNQPIPRSEIKRYLQLETCNDEGVVRSIERSNWLTCQDGRHVIEVRNSIGDLARKMREGEVLYMSDLDDTLIDTTGWHQKEFDLIQKLLGEKGVEASIADIERMYELSKIKVPGKADIQTRYTPQLNLILLEQYRRRRLDQKMSSTETMVWIEQQQQRIQEVVSTAGEEALNDYILNTEFQREMVSQNPTSDFVHLPLIRDLFDWGDGMTNDSVIRVIITRGKIESPLGQVYKVHQSGIMELPSVDIVVYTNDIKVEALLHLQANFPGIMKRWILLYDDNPNEIVPFYEQIEETGISPFPIELVQVRHSSSKRRDKPVIVPNKKEGGTRQVPPDVSLGYALLSTEISITSFEQEVQPESSGNDHITSEKTATIFDHHVSDERGMGTVL